MNNVFILKSLSQLAEKNFLILVLAATFVGSLKLAAFTAVLPYMKIMLAIIIFSMGMTLKLEDFSYVLKAPKAVFIGILAQYTIMPFVAMFLTIAFKLPAEFAIGMILVGSCPGGTASNVMVYLSQGNLALSVVMTMLSTFLAPIILPALMYFFASKWIEVNPLGLFFSTVQIVLIPIILGILFKKLLPKFSEKLEEGVPLLAIFIICILIAALVTVNMDKLNDIKLLSTVIIAVMLHNSLGLSLGYLLAKILGQDEANRRAISIEVGMQNSGLAAVLAAAHFGPLAALPSVIFSIWHNISGSSLVSLWQKET